jgi:8-oxo-dGTP diphosphatase
MNEKNLLPQISVSVKAAILRETQILLLSYDDHSGFHYNLPGGKARENESLRTAVTRKVAQETGLLVAATRLLLVVEYLPERFKHLYGSQHKLQFNFLAREEEQREVRRSLPEDPDQVGFEWVPVSELPNKRLLPNITRELIAALAAPAWDAFDDAWM